MMFKNLKKLYFRNKNSIQSVFLHISIVPLLHK